LDVEASTELETAGANPHAAWAYWQRWAGNCALIPHVARTAARAAADRLDESALCSIDVRIPVRPDGHDFERVESPEEFQKTISSEALRRFDSIRILVCHPKLEVEVVLARATGFGPEWLDRGVLLEVRAADVRIDAAAVREIRDRTLWALNRGLPRFRRKIEFGDGRAPVPRELTRRRAIAWVDEHFGPGAIRRLAKLMPDPELLTDPSTNAKTSEAAERGQTPAALGAPAQTSQQIDPRLRDLAAGFSNRPEDINKLRLLLRNPPPDVADYILKEHPDWIEHPERVRPFRFLVESGHWLWPALVAFVAGLTSLGWGRYALALGITAGLVGLFFSHQLSELLLFQVQFTDVSRIRRILIRVGIWVFAGPGIGIMTFSLGQWLRWKGVG
jgi:hypothetical protein